MRTTAPPAAPPAIAAVCEELLPSTGAVGPGGGVLDDEVTGALEELDLLNGSENGEDEVVNTLDELLAVVIGGNELGAGASESGGSVGNVNG